MTTMIEHKLEQVITTDTLRRKRYIFNISRQSYQGPYSSVIDFPKVPVIHPYNPNGRDGKYFYDAGIPSFPVVIKFSGQAINNLSNNTKLLALLAQYSIDIEALEVFFCVQNMPWLDESIKFRPHAWLDNGGDNQNYNIMFAVSNNINDFKITPDNISIHDGLFSPDNMALLNDLQDLEKTKNFYSFCFNTETKRAAITLHWLLNLRDYNSLSTFLEQHSNLSLSQVITWSQSLSDPLSVEALKELGNTEIIYSENTRSANNAVDFEIIDDEPEVTPTTNPLLNNIVINYNVFNKEIMPQLTDSITFELIVDPVFFPGRDETVYNRSTIASMINRERGAIVEQLGRYYDAEASTVIANTLTESSINFESPANRIIVNTNSMRSARLFIDVILIAIHYANNIDLNNINIDDNNLKEDLLAAINDLINSQQRYQAAETILINAMQRDLRNSNSGLTNHQLELLNDWGIITTSPRVTTRVRPRENDNNLPSSRRHLSHLFPDIISPPSNVFFRFSTTSSNAGIVSEISRRMTLEREAIDNPLVARMLGA